MSAFVLRQHRFLPNAEVEIVPAPDAPPISDVMERALRRRVMGPLRDDLPVSWHHGESRPWSAAADLLEAGQEGEALALGRLLRWCAQRANGRTRGCWEIARNAEEAAR